MTKLKNKKAIITGGGRGLGKATAIAFAKEGIDIAITGRNETVLKETVSELETFGIQAIYAVFDVSNYEDVKRGIKSIMNTLGPIDILVNNGGISQRSPIIETSIEVDKKLMEIDYLGTIALTKAILLMLPVAMFVSSGFEHSIWKTCWSRFFFWLQRRPSMGDHS